MRVHQTKTYSIRRERHRGDKEQAEEAKEILNEMGCGLIMLTGKHISSPAALTCARSSQVAKNKQLHSPVNHFSLFN